MFRIGARRYDLGLSEPGNAICSHGVELAAAEQEPPAVGDTIKPTSQSGFDELLQVGRDDLSRFGWTRDRPHASLREISWGSIEMDARHSLTRRHEK
jgi:hypothetical protein